MTQIDADADAEICPDCAEIQAAVSDRRELDDDTGVDSSDVQADIITASFSDAVQSSRTLHAYLEANSCLDSADGGCVLCIGEKGSALMVHGGVRTLHLNAQFTEG